MIELIEIRTDDGYKPKLFSDLPAYDDSFEANQLRSQLAYDEVNNKDNDNVFIRCGCCQERLYLKSLYNVYEEQRSYFLSHCVASDKTKDPDCPQRANNSKQHLNFLRALKYRGQQEGQQHYRLKHLIAKALHHDANIPDESILIEQRISREKEWRKPDVQAIVQGKVTAFEVQLATEFITMIHHRQYFYRQFGHIIWVLPKLNIGMLNQSQLDIAHSNGQHLFVLDKEHELLSESSNTFHLLCWINMPLLEGNHITRRWEFRTVTLDDIYFVDGIAQVVDTQAVQDELCLKISEKPLKLDSLELERFLDDYRCFLRKVAFLSPEFIKQRFNRPTATEKDKKIVGIYLRLNGLFINNDTFSKHISETFRSIERGRLVIQHIEHTWLWNIKHVHQHHSEWVGLIIHLLKIKGVWDVEISNNRDQLMSLIKENRQCGNKPSRDQYRIARFLMPMLENREDHWNIDDVINNIKSIGYPLTASWYCPDLKVWASKSKLLTSVDFYQQLSVHKASEAPFPNLPIEKSTGLVHLDIHNTVMPKLISNFQHQIDEMNAYLSDLVY